MISAVKYENHLYDSFTLSQSLHFVSDVIKWPAKGVDVVAESNKMSFIHEIRSFLIC